MTGLSEGQAGGAARQFSPIDFSQRLNPAQYEAVTTVDGPVLVVAGAGSGKTRTLVHRVAYLVEQGVNPEAILLLTFTRKAAAEMLHRAAQLVGHQCNLVSGGTFHALANLLLRRWADRLGFPPGFGVMDRGDMEEVLGQLRKQAKLREKDKSFPKRSTLATIISKAVNKSVSLEQLISTDFVHLSDYQDDMMVLARDYALFKQENAIMDFDDLLVLLDRLLRDDETARSVIAAKYSHIMVDEYQDTNLLQADIVYQLGKDHKNVMVVGDDAQSIYSFRGATFQNIMRFPDIFGQTRIIRLEENYRSRQPILNLTNHIISQATEKYDKKLFTRREGGEKPRVLTLASQMEQSLFICNKIRELADQGVGLSEMAVLFRASRHSFKLELELARNKIDYVKYGGRRFLDAAHIKDLLSILRVVANPRDGVSLTRALLLMDGIGPTTAAKVVAWTDGQRERIMTLHQYAAKSKVKSGLEKLAAVMARICPRGVELTDRINLAWDFYQPLMEARFDDFPSRMADIKEFLSLAQGYTSLNRFLTDMALEPPNASGPTGKLNFNQEKLVLSTVHSSKGLEWKVVFIIWAVEGRFPPFYVEEGSEELDEERRLMYVAATRAKDHLYILCPLEMDYDSGGYRPPPKPSRFLANLPYDLVATRDKDSVIPKKADPGGNYPAGQAWGSDYPATPTDGDYSVGQRVSHPVFGLGRVIAFMGGKKIRVNFDHFGPKTLSLEHAGLKNVN